MAEYNDIDDLEPVLPDPEPEPEPDPEPEPKPEEKNLYYPSIYSAALVAKVLAGRCGMRYTRAAVGSGIPPEDTNFAELRDPIGYVMDANIASVSNPVAGECQVEVQVCSDDVDEAFYATHIILYALDPDEGEVPYTIFDFSDMPQGIRAKREGVGIIASFDLVAIVGAVKSVSADLSSNAFVTRRLVEQIVAQNVLARSAVIPTTGWDIGAPEAEGTLYRDVVVEDAKPAQTPFVTLLPSAESEARRCGLKPAARAIAGAIRFYSDKKPDEPIPVEITLLHPYDGPVEDEAPEQRGTLTYNGREQQADWAHFDPDRYIITGTYIATNAGTYMASFVPKVGYAWADGSTSARICQWRIEPAITGVPEQRGTLTYNGEMQTPDLGPEYAASKFAEVGEIQASEAGTYIAALTPNGNYTWADGSRVEKIVTWSIGKAQGKLEVDRNTVELEAGQTGTVLATALGDGQIAATSDNTAVASVTVTDDIVSILARGVGSTEVTVNCSEGANYFEAASQIIQVTVTAAS